MMKWNLRNFYLRIARAEGSPRSIARGVAIGLSVGLIIPIGFQSALAIFLAFLLKANKILSWSFTCVTNPATVFFIYPIQCYVGSFVLLNPLKIHSFTEKFHELTAAETYSAAFAAFGALGWDIILPFFTGGFLFAVLFAPLGYWISYKLAEGYQIRREKKRLLRQQKESSGDGPSPEK